MLPSSLNMEFWVRHFNASIEFEFGKKSHKWGFHLGMRALLEWIKCIVGARFKWRFYSVCSRAGFHSKFEASLTFLIYFTCLFVRSTPFYRSSNREKGSGPDFVGYWWRTIGFGIFPWGIFLPIASDKWNHRRPHKLNFSNFSAHSQIGEKNQKTF